MLRYWEFKEQLVELYGDRELPEQIGLVFTMPMPIGWTEKKKSLMDGKPHQAKPDLDNMIKACWDSLADSDSYIWRVDAAKYWGRDGSIEIRELSI